MSLTLEAESRDVMGKGASRRLRRLENKVPGILYGGNKKPLPINLQHNKVLKALENEAVFSSVLDLQLDGKVEKVILKDLQRHPYKPVILHMDLQRVSAKDVLVKLVPLHFMNEDTAPGVKSGGVISHTMNQVEVRCEAQNLPQYIEVDLGKMELDQVLHLSDLKLPKGVEFSVDITEEGQNQSVVSIHMPKAQKEEEEAPAAAATEAEASAEAEAKEAKENKEEKE